MPACMKAESPNTCLLTQHSHHEITLALLEPEDKFAITVPVFPSYKQKLASRPNAFIRTLKSEK